MVLNEHSLYMCANISWHHHCRLCRHHHCYYLHQTESMDVWACIQNNNPRSRPSYTHILHTHTFILDNNLRNFHDRCDNTHTKFDLVFVARKKVNCQTITLKLFSLEKRNTKRLVFDFSFGLGLNSSTNNTTTSKIEHINAMPVPWHKNRTNFYGQAPVFQKLLSITNGSYMKYIYRMSGPMNNSKQQQQNPHQQLNNELWIQMGQMKKSTHTHIIHTFNDCLCRYKIHKTHQ